MVRQSIVVPLTRDIRENVYLRQTGRKKLTARQQRRVRRKYNKFERPNDEGEGATT